VLLIAGRPADSVVAALTAEARMEQLGLFEAILSDAHLVDLDLSG
jgi:hypothetical protein